MSHPPSRKLGILSLAAGLSLAAFQGTATDQLERAIVRGDLKTMEALLAAGLDPNLPDSRGQNPLSFALVAVHQLNAVSLLLKWHADPNKPLDNRVRNGELPETPLLYVMNSGDLQLISLFLANGASVNTQGPGGRTALHLAVAASRPDTLKVLLEKAADPNLRDAEGASPLDDAVWRGSVEEVALLLEHGAYLNEPDAGTGATPVNEAAFRGNVQVLQFLLQFNPDFETPDKRGFTPLDNAIRMSKEDAALLLLAAEPKEHLTAPFLDKTINAAISKNQARLVDALLRDGVSVNSTLPSGTTLLGAAAFAGAADVVRILLAADADPNLSDSDGATPLWNASLRGFEAIAGTLLDHGAKIDQLNTSSATTALYAAASLGQQKVVQLLLDRGADSAVCAANHKSSYQIALQNGYREVATQLQNSGGATGCKQ